MCLTLKSSETKPKIATKDIVCYKGIIETPKGFITPYQGFKVKIGKTYFSEIYKYDDEIDVGLHSFAIYEEMIAWEKREIEIRKGAELKPVKCIIPRGATYYTGEFSTNKSYASSELKYVELID